MADWNPPPPEQEEPGTASKAVPDEDRIGDTVFSKAWVLSLLVEAVRAVESTSESQPEHKSACVLNLEESKVGREEVANEEGEERSVCQDGSAPALATEGEGGENGGKETVESRSMQVKEISEDLENDLCQLWDVSMNEDVTKFLVDHHAVDLLMEVANRSEAPRLTEICVGILGNLACQEEVCKNTFSSTETIVCILRLLKNIDPLVLLETTRLIYTCLCHKSVFREWTKAIQVTTSVHEDLKFILKSSMNEDLLKNVAVLLDKLLDSTEELLSDWATRELLLAMCEACEQTKLSSFDATCTFVMTLQLFSTISSGIAVIVDCKEELCNVLLEFLTSVDVMDHCRATMAALCLLVTLSDNVKTSLPVDFIPALSKLKTCLESSLSNDPSATSGCGGHQQGSAAEHVTGTCDETPELDPLPEKMLKVVEELICCLDR